MVTHGDLRTTIRCLLINSFHEQNLCENIFIDVTMVHVTFEETTE